MTQDAIDRCDAEIAAEVRRLGEKMLALGYQPCELPTALAPSSAN